MAHHVRSFRLIVTTALLAAVGGIVALTVLAAGDPVAPDAVKATAAPGNRDGGANGPAAASGAERAPLVAANGCWTAPIGSSFRFRVVDHVDVALHSTEKGRQPGGAIHTECEVTSTVLDRRGSEVLVSHQIDALRFVGADGQAISGDPIQQSFAAAATAPVNVRIDGAGRVLGLGFAAELNGDQRNFLRGTLGLLAFESPADGATTWTSRVEDTTGEFEARHELLPETTAGVLAIRRTRVRYTTVAGHREVPQHEVRGTTEARFATALGWLQSVRVDEGLTLALSILDLHAITARSAEVVLLGNSTVAVDRDVAALWQNANAPASGRDETVGAHAKDSERKRWQQQLASITVDQLLAELQRLLAAEPVDEAALDGVFQQLTWKVTLGDSVAAELLERITTRQLAEGAARSVLGALGAAGTPAAQHTLASVRGDASLDDGVRASATFACLQLAEPDAAIVNGLFAEAAAESPLRSPSLLVLGALAPRATSPLADGRTPRQAILAMEGDAAARGELATWVLAVANSKAPETLAVAQRLLDHGDPAVRGACCVAIRGVAGAAALDALVQRGLADTDPTVRYEAVLALSRRNEPGARQALEHATHDADETVRTRARRALGQS